MSGLSEKVREQQTRYKKDVLSIKDKGKWRGKLYDHILPEEVWEINLWDGIREAAQLYFQTKKIAWHKDKHNMLSSQIMCLNIFFPLKQHLDVLKTWLSSEFSDVGNVVDLDFEYIGPNNKNYFNEEGGRGQNRTSSDISIVWLDKANRKNMLLLEFKFNESSFGKCGQDKNPNPKRCLFSRKIIASPKTQCYRAQVKRTYWDIILSDKSPFKKEYLTATSYCPFRYDFYQLMRNQLLAHCIKSDSQAGFHKVEFGVIYHADNNELLRMSHPFDGKRDPLKAWPSLLRNPDSFHVSTTQNFIHTIEISLPDTLNVWRKYIKERYEI